MSQYLLRRTLPAWVQESSTPQKTLENGDAWSDAAMAKYLLGEEIVEILTRFGIHATCVE
jgi:hypothetical protein